MELPSLDPIETNNSENSNSVVNPNEEEEEECLRKDLLNQIAELENRLYLHENGFNMQAVDQRNNTKKQREKKLHMSMQKMKKQYRPFAKGGIWIKDKLNSARYPKRVPETKYDIKKMENEDPHGLVKGNVVLLSGAVQYTPSTEATSDFQETVSFPSTPQLPLQRTAVTAKYYFNRDMAITIRNNYEKPPLDSAIFELYFDIKQGVSHFQLGELAGSLKEIIGFKSKEIGYRYEVSIRKKLTDNNSENPKIDHKESLCVSIILYNQTLIEQLKIFLSSIKAVDAKVIFEDSLYNCLEDENFFKFLSSNTMHVQGEAKTFVLRAISNQFRDKPDLQKAANLLNLMIALRNLTIEARIDNIYNLYLADTFKKGGKTPKSVMASVLRSPDLHKIFSQIYMRTLTCLEGFSTIVFQQRYHVYKAEFYEFPFFRIFPDQEEISSPRLFSFQSLDFGKEDLTPLEFAIYQFTLQHRENRKKKKKMFVDAKKFTSSFTSTQSKNCTLSKNTNNNHKTNNNNTNNNKNNNKNKDNTNNNNTNNNNTNNNNTNNTNTNNNNNNNNQQNNIKPVSKKQKRKEKAIKIFLTKKSTLNLLHPETQQPFVAHEIFSNLFQSVRQDYFGITEDQWNESFSEKPTLFKMKSEGQSGSIFGRTQNNRFILKSISHGEFRFLFFLIPNYLNHFKKHPNSLLSKIYGIYFICIEGREICWIVLDNAFYSTKKIHEKYDLKGSTEGRAVTSPCSKDETTFRDLDFKKTLKLGPEKKKQFLETIHQDCLFFENYQIMDYSLLIGIHKVDPSSPNLASESDPRGVLSSDGKEIYFFCLIDILTTWTLRKQLESNFKGILFTQNVLSAIAPPFYSSRFQHFLARIVE